MMAWLETYDGPAVSTKGVLLSETTSSLSTSETETEKRGLTNGIHGTIDNRTPQEELQFMGHMELDMNKLDSAPIAGNRCMLSDAKATYSSNCSFTLAPVSTSDDTMASSDNDHSIAITDANAPTNELPDHDQRCDQPKRAEMIETTQLYSSADDNVERPRTSLDRVAACADSYDGKPSSTLISDRSRSGSTFAGHLIDRKAVSQTARGYYPSLEEPCFDESSLAERVTGGNRTDDFDGLLVRTNHTSLFSAKLATDLTSTTHGGMSNLNSSAIWARKLATSAVRTESDPTVYETVSPCKNDGKEIGDEFVRKAISYTANEWDLDELQDLCLHDSTRDQSNTSSRYCELELVPTSETETRHKQYTLLGDGDERVHRAQCNRSVEPSDNDDSFLPCEKNDGPCYSRISPESPKYPACKCARANGRCTNAYSVGDDGLSQLCREQVTIDGVTACNCPCDACNPEDSREFSDYDGLHVITCAKAERMRIRTMLLVVRRLDCGAAVEPLSEYFKQYYTAKVSWKVRRTLRAVYRAHVMTHRLWSRINSIRNGTCGLRIEDRLSDYFVYAGLRFRTSRMKWSDTGAADDIRFVHMVSSSGNTIIAIAPFAPVRNVLSSWQLIDVGCTMSHLSDIVGVTSLIHKQLDAWNWETDDDDAVIVQLQRLESTHIEAAWRTYVRQAKDADRLFRSQ